VLFLFAPFLVVGRQQDIQEARGGASPSAAVENAPEGTANLTLVYDRSAAADAQLLMQATFGPTASSLAELAEVSDYASWIHAQFELTPTSHREYYRARVNSRLVGNQGVGAYRLPCQAGSRWNAFAFSVADKGKPVVVTDNMVYVDGLLRTHVDPLYAGNNLSEPPRSCTDDPSERHIKRGKECGDVVDHKNLRNCAYGGTSWTEPKICQQSCFDSGHGYPGDDCSPGWASLEFEGLLCEVDEEVGGWVALGNGSDCDSRSWVGFENPAVWFSSPRASADALAFQQLRAGVVLLAETVSPCPISDVVYHRGQHYIHDQRLALVRNDLGTPATGTAEACPAVARTFLNEGSCQVQPACSGPHCTCSSFQACGSPGELASDPESGHHFSFLVDEDAGDTDLDYDSGARGQMRLSKSTVWANVALHAQDQLRQRVAWALSQVLVVSMAGFSSNPLNNEAWVNYYDIFVRNAFGNYRDVLREVTYSPLMGDYLSFRDSQSRDEDRRYPDENYAREIMQLFSIGLWELHPNGTQKLDGQGDAIPTYTNEHVMTFARVFTGFKSQAMRANIEYELRNGVDPMRMRAQSHDVYPKPDLNGDYLGDGYPLCDDIPAHAFLSAGARYEFLGYDHAHAGVLEVSPDSALYGALFPLKSTVVLTADLECFGDECNAGGISVVKVSEGYYEYVRPACAHLYFFNGRIVAPGGSKFHKLNKQKCARPSAMAAGTSCCRGCTNEPTRRMTRRGLTCEEPHSDMFGRDCYHRAGWRSSKYCQLACWQNGVGYEGDNCSEGSFASERVCAYFRETVRFSTASAICESRGMHVCERQTPRGTGTCGFNNYAFLWTPQPCGVDVEVHADGTVSSQMDSKSMQNRISVHWYDGHPAMGSCPDSCVASASGCICPISVKDWAVFGSVPTKAQLRERLRIGALAPGALHSCLAPCNGDVKAYVQAGEIDATTIFECEGAFFKNAESVVSVEGYSFRNPPVFMLGAASSRNKETREALAEVESLLDHLFFHDNTPPFLAYRLIQRLTTSSPSPEYVSDVAQAFGQGKYGGTVYSGEYGDLRAAVAAVLLHPEARGQVPEARAGQLREPMVKTVHFMRAMEYRGTAGRLDVFRNLQEVVGQFPYESPSVFNFYGVDYHPTGFADGMVAPEFEIFTPPLALGWLNGMLSLIDHGLSTCDKGIGVRIRSCNFLEGGITWTSAGNSSEMLQELSLLLTGGRLAAIEAIGASLESLSDEERLPAALRAILMSAEFHTLGEPLASGLRAESEEPEVPPEPDSYKAMVMLYLGGGADTFNMLVPLCDDLYDEYVAVRSDIALTPSQLRNISAPTQNCTLFGVHHKLPFVRQLYEEGQLAFVSNIGSLVQPTTREEYRAKTSQNCAGRFSHLDQRNGAQTLKCQVPGKSPRGFGGRLADALAGESYLATSFSLSGMSTWSQGFITSVEIISGAEGNLRLQGYQDLRAVVRNATQIKYGGAYADEYAKQFSSAVRSSESLSGYLDEVVLATDYDDRSILKQKLMQVARLIATRTARKAERDFFYVQLSGFDTHSDNNAGLDAKFTEVSDALEGFVAEMKAQDIFESIVLVTMSEFGRTLTSNGGGSDHAWAGNHFVLGGGISGGNIFNDFPESLLEGNNQDAGRGRLIPKYPWESMMVPIAEWIGADPSSASFASVFPNLANFNQSKHIISKTDLFNNYDLV
jgi:cullin-associated NEDD8-dissociated protein 1